MSDLISRQDAIDYIKTQRGRPFIGITLEEAIIMMIEEVPSAEPKTPSNGSITCINAEKIHDRTMGDLISRQEAKDAIDMALDHIDHVPPWVYDKLLNTLNEVPSAEKAQLSEEDATSDLISRKEAIDEILSLTNCDTVEELRAYVIEHDLGSWWSGGVLSSVGKVERLPSAGGCKCPCVYREPCDVCHYDAYRRHGCPAEEGLKDE